MSFQTAQTSDSSSSSKVTKAETVAFDEKESGDGGKLKFILSMLKKVIGVADIINMRLSLPSQVLDPIPNLDYFNWLDRPDYFACISESDDPVERMVAVARYSFTRYVKYMESKIVKPYNSILGEYFICHYDVTLPGTEKRVQVNMLNEQTSHHPPVSAFWYECPETGVVAHGNDHISAKFTGTTIKVVPGELAKGIYITLRNRDNEEYHITHCSAYIQGFLTGNLGIGLGDRVVISCPATGLRVIKEFKAENFFGKNKFAVGGKIFKFQPTFTESQVDADLPCPSFNLNSIKEEELIATLGGSWKGDITIRYNGSKTDETLITLPDLKPVPKVVKPFEDMDKLESRKVWKDVTDNILSKEFSKATKAKIAIEEEQREKTRLRDGQPYEPQFFYTKEGYEHRPYLKPSFDLKF